MQLRHTACMNVNSPFKRSEIKKLPVVGKLGQGGSSPDQHVEVVQGGDGSGQVPLGRVQLLNVPGDLFHLQIQVKL